MRSEGDFIKVNEWLLPLSWIYGAVVTFRNWMFDIGILKSRAYDIPVISVGNITVGGAGKTPHVEHLVRLLQEKMKVAVLSRGYKRKTKGYLLADSSSTARDIGDEPLQMKQKFPKTYIAVDKKRRRGIDRLTHHEATSDVDVILLDDAFQHRYVKPGINILLVDYHRLIIYDKLLPAGRLRESMKGKRRADMVIITKCPKDLKPMEYRVLTKALDLYAYQDLYFTTLEYDNLHPLFSHKSERPLKSIKPTENVLLVTGIASPQHLLEDLKPFTHNIRTLNFPDHHYFSGKDIARINETFKEMAEPKLIITTEKDAVRLKAISGFSDEVKAAIYTLPIHIKFLHKQDETFNTKILNYVQKNSRNSILVKRKDDDKPQDCNHSGERTRRISF